MADQLIVLEKVAKILESAKIGYMITGSIAFNYYAVPRMTKDSISEIQIRDVSNLISCVKPLDLKYLEFWIKKLELKELYEMALK
jgi:hypothetical protein